MKRLISFMVMAILLVPLAAQTDQNYFLNEKVNVISATIPVDAVPATIHQAINTRFDKDNPLTWSKVPYTLKEFGWVYEVGSGDIPLTNYEVNIKTRKGDNLWANYNAEGNLTETRMLSRDIAVPRYILDALADSPYKDWKVIGDKEIVNFFPGDGATTASAQQNFRLTVEKEKARKKLGFKYMAGAGKYQAYVIK